MVSSADEPRSYAFIKCCFSPRLRGDVFLSVVWLRYSKGDIHLSLEDELLKQRLSRIREIEALGYRAYGQR